jgi:hypothetical protein
MTLRIENTPYMSLRDADVSASLVSTRQFDAPINTGYDPFIAFPLLTMNKVLSHGQI